MTIIKLYRKLFHKCSECGHILTSYERNSRSYPHCFHCHTILFKQWVAEIAHAQGLEISEDGSVILNCSPDLVFKRHAYLRIVK